MKSIQELVSKPPYEKIFSHVCPTCGEKVYHCVNSDLGIDFMTLCSCEIEKENQERERELTQRLISKTYEQRLSVSNISSKMLEMLKTPFRTNQNNINAYNLISRYCDNFNRKTSLGLFLSGSCGVGKTHLIIWCADMLLRKGEDVYFTNVNEMFNEIKKSYSAEAPIDYERFIKQVQILVLDDLGAEYMKEFDAKKLFEIVDTRNRHNLQTLYTSNLNVDGLRKKYSDDTKGLNDIDADRIVSRILGYCESATINDVDHRIASFMERKKNG